MAGSWGPKDQGVRIGIFWDSIQISGDGAQGRIVNGKLRCDRPSGFKTDADDWVSFYGWDVANDIDAEMNLSGGGVRDVATLTAKWVPLQYGATRSESMDANISFSDSKHAFPFHDVTVVFPARAFQLPAAPSAITVTRNSDVSYKLQWANNPTVPAPYTNVVVQRRVLTAGGWGAWTTVQTLAGTATTWTDTTTTADKRYTWRVAGSNSTGLGAAATTADYATTPAPPVNITLTKTGQTITVGWENKALYQTGVYIEHAQNGVWGAAEQLGAAVVSKVYNSVNPSVSHQFRVRAYNGLHSGYLTSGTITVAAPPLAPTVTVDPTALDAALTDLAVSWTHNPTDYTAQTAHQVQCRTNGAGAWTTLSGTTATTRTIPAGTLANGQVYEVQVRTRGDDPTYGPWSASKLITTAATPSVTVTAPDTAVSRPAIPWEYTGATGQSAWIATLYDAASEALEQRTGAGATATVTFDHVLDDATTYRVGIAAADGIGLWSVETFVTWATDLARPPAPTLTAAYDPETGSVDLTVTTPAPGAGETTAVAVEVWRDGALVGTTDPNGSLADPVPPLGVTVHYRAIAWGDPPTSAESALVPVETEFAGWVFLNGGPGFAQQARLKANPTVNETISREKVLHNMSGPLNDPEVKPVEFIGLGVARTLKVAGEVDGFGLHPDLGDFAPFGVVAALPAPICYRDPWRRVFGSIGAVSIANSAKNARAGVGFTLTEVDYAE